jgi:hypothetical protein
MMKRYRKAHKDPHPSLKAALAALLATALSEKKRLLLTYVAENGKEGLLDYGNSILERGLNKYFDSVSFILNENVVDSTIETLQASGLDLTENFVRNVDQHNKQIARDEAARLLGAHYDHGHGVAVATVAGFAIGHALIAQLGDLLSQAKTDGWSLNKIEKGISTLSGFSAKRAEAIAQNSLAFVSGRSARNVAAMTGAMEKMSETVGDDRVCDECDTNAADGWIGINDRFSGSDTEDVPHHPGCRCDVVYQWMDAGVAA